MRTLPFFKGKKGYQFAGGGVSSDSGGGELPIATDSTLGGVIVGDNLNITSDGVLSSLFSFGFSTTEKKTGLKTHDGKDIYCRFVTKEVNSTPPHTPNIYDNIIYVMGFYANNGSVNDVRSFSWQWFPNYLSLAPWGEGSGDHAVSNYGIYHLLLFYTKS